MIDKYSIHNLKEDDGVSKKSPFIEMIDELKNDNSLSWEEKINAFYMLCVELNLQVKDLSFGHNAAIKKLDVICKYVLIEQEHSIMKCKDILFHGR